MLHYISTAVQAVVQQAVHSDDIRCTEVKIENIEFAPDIILDLN